MRSVCEILKQGCDAVDRLRIPRATSITTPSATGGALLCHYRHRAHEDPFFYPGLQDITASVDFSALAQAAPEHGLRLAGYCPARPISSSAAAWPILLRRRKTGLAGPTRPFPGQVKRLTLPGEMGRTLQGHSLHPDFHRAIDGVSIHRSTGQIVEVVTCLKAHSKTRSSFLPPPIVIPANAGIQSYKESPFRRPIIPLDAGTSLV